MKKIIFLILLLLCSNAYALIIDENTICKQNICTYSSMPNYIKEDGIWKHYTEAKSLKDTDYKMVFTEIDKDYPMDIIEYNATSVTLDLKRWEILNTAIPIKIHDGNKETPKETFTETFNLFDLGKKRRTFYMKKGEFLTFGDNSTTITLQTPNTENLQDAYVEYGSPTTNRGSLQYLVLREKASFKERIYITFNISSIPEGSTILDSTLYLYIYLNNLGAGDYLNATLHNVTFSWEESSITWNNQPLHSSGFTDSYKILNTDINKFLGWNATSLVSSQMPKGNVSLLLNITETNTADNTDYVRFYSKEYTTSNLRPILNITYTTGADETPPTISSLRNTSTTNISSYIEWNCDENCNYTINLYNNSIRTSTYLVDTLYNNTFALNHNPYFDDLINSTYYYLNLTVWDSSGNSAVNNTFNFTTANNPPIPPSPSEKNILWFNYTVNEFGDYPKQICFALSDGSFCFNSSGVIP